MLKGSGEVLIASLPPAFDSAVPAVIVPPISPATVTSAGSVTPSENAASSAPAGMRTKVCSESQNESKPGTLSATVSASSITPLAPITSGCLRISRLACNCR